MDSHRYRSMTVHSKYPFNGTLGNEPSRSDATDSASSKLRLLNKIVYSHQYYFNR